MHKFTIVLLAFLSFGCTHQPDNQEDIDLDMRSVMTELMGGEPAAPNQHELSQHPLGSKENPIRVDGPSGEREYISRLICMNGEPISYAERVGSSGISPYGFMMDMYSVTCDTEEGVISKIIFMDMYHRNNEETGVADGFLSIKPTL